MARFCWLSELPVCLRLKENAYNNRYKKHKIEKVNLFIEKEDLYTETRKIFSYDSINFYSNYSLY